MLTHCVMLRLLLAYCTNESPEPSLLSKCSLLTSDATLVSLFRTGAAPLPCPIKGPLEFTYSQGEGECNSPRSRAEACTQESRLLLRYQACANVHSSESVGQYVLPPPPVLPPTLPRMILHLPRHNTPATRDRLILRKSTNLTIGLSSTCDKQQTGSHMAHLISF